MQTFVLTILVLGLLVFVHELGHFLTAKWAGIAVPRFSIGLGPRVVGVQFGETDYCLSAIPFGGYVKMAGMEGEEAFEGLEGGAEGQPDEARVPRERRFESKSRAWRLAVLSAGVIMNFLLGWSIYVGLALTEGITTIPGTEVAAVEPAAVERYAELEGLAGSTIARVDGRPVSNWNEIEREMGGGGSPLILTLESGRRIEIPVAGEEERQRLSNAVLPLVPPVVAEVEAGGPADRAGIRSGDRIVSVDGVETPSFGAVSDEIQSRPDRVVPVVVRRAGPGETPRELTLTVRTGTEKAPRETDGRFVDVGVLGVSTQVERIPLGLDQSLYVGSVASIRASTLILGGLVDLVTGGVSMRSLGGPVAIGQLTGHFARQGLASLLGWVALFSINLAILNLLPIPVLDGGHILFLGIEALRGRPLSTRQKVRLSQVGLVFLGLLMAWAFTADILRLVGF